MKLQYLCPLTFLACLLLSVRESRGVFVPGRCLCPSSEAHIRAKPLEFSVYNRSPQCDTVTVIVTLKRNNQLVCLDPESRQGKHLVRCWNRAHRLGRDPQNCMRRRRRKGRGRNGLQNQRSLLRSLRHRASKTSP